MKKIKSVTLAFAVLAAFTGQVFCQNTLQFTSINATPEKAIQLHWASNSNEVYEIDEADALIDTNTGSITWNKLYDDYPSQGTNTFIADDGNYDITPEISHPKFSPMRFYRVGFVETNTSASNPTVSIISPTNGASLSGDVTIQVSANSDEILSNVKLYIDGEEQWPSDDDSNFVVNTCEWLNGSHTIFATAESQSGLEGIPNSSEMTYGRSVSSFVNVTFSNLISGFNFSQPFFEPALGQTQVVTATFAANCDWTLQIQDVNSNTVRTVTGSGTSMSFNWDGTGDGETNIPDGVYNYMISAQTNGLAPQDLVGDSLGLASASDLTGLWAMTAGGSGDAVPLALYPQGFDTNNLIIFQPSESQILAQNQSISDAESEDDNINPAYAGPASQSTSGPTRKPKTGVKGNVGTFGVLYKTYSLNGFNSPHPATGWPYPLPTTVAVDGQSATAHTMDYRILAYKDIANEFTAEMKRAGWKQQFLEADDQWSATDIKKTSLGGNSIFNNCNFGLLMTHGSYATTPEDDNIKYTYVWLGPNNYVRLSDMDFGSDGTNGLKWMTIYACSILNSSDYNSMNNNFKIPVNENLHLLIGPSTYTYAWYGFGYHYANNLTHNNQTIVDAFDNAGITEATINSLFVTNTIKFAVSYWPACLNDSLTLYNDPDPGDGLQYEENLIFNYSP